MICVDVARMNQLILQSMRVTSKKAVKCIRTKQTIALTHQGQIDRNPTPTHQILLI